MSGLSTLFQKNCQFLVQFYKQKLWGLLNMNVNDFKASNDWFEKFKKVMILFKKKSMVK